MAGKGKGPKDKKNKGKAKALTAQGVAFEPKDVAEVYEPGDTCDTEFYRFSLMQLEFLQEYAKDLDANRAASAAGYKNYRTSAEKLLKNPAVRRELEAIHDAWRYNIRMTGEHASARHIKLMDKLERDYDASEIGDRAKLATSMVRASDSYLRAAGHFNQGGGGTESQVVINIDMGDSDGTVKIDGEEQ